MNHKNHKPVNGLMKRKERRDKGISRKDKPKFNPLTERDKKLLLAIYRNNFDYLKSYNEVFGDKTTITEENKRKYISTFFHTKREWATEFIEELIKEEFRNCFVTKEHIALKLLKLAGRNENRNKPEADRVAVNIYQFIAKMMGYIWDKVEIAKIEPIEISYLTPTIEINPVEILNEPPKNNNPMIEAASIQTNTETGYSMEIPE